VKPLADFPLADRRALLGVLTDIDDTITSDGQLTAAAYGALERLRDAGLRVVPVTGRPAGWCDLIARLWPVDAVVGENGAFYMHYDRKGRRLRTVHGVDATTRAARRERLAALGEEIIAAVPGCALASDQAYREADLAIDFCEDVPPLPAEAVDAIVRRMESAGLTAKISSIHVNGWFGTYDKLSMTRRLVAEVFGGDLDRDRQRWVFLGDSPNDAPMFGFFPHAIGVANVRALADRTAHLPAYITEAASGAGFVEACEFLLER
jgi:HAD superfamily hydrolase (TIGR01484 family)